MLRKEKMRDVFSRKSKRKDDFALTRENMEKIESAAIAPSDRLTARIRRAVFAFSMTVLGFLLAGTAFPGETFPLGAALAAAVPHALPFAAAGAALRTAYEMANGNDLILWGGIAAVAVWLMRWLFAFLLYGRSAFHRTGTVPDEVPARVLICAVCELGCLLLRVSREGVTQDSLLPVAVGTVCAVSFAFLLSFFFEDGMRDTSAGTAGLGAFCFCLALSVAGIEIRNFSVGLLLSYALTLYIGYRDEATKSAAVGLLCGLACGGIYAPVFALAGLVAGIFFDVSCLLAAIGSTAVMVCGGLYFGGQEALLGFLPEIGAATVLVTVPALFHLLPDPSRARVPSGADCREILLRRREEDRARRMEMISDSMNALSIMMHELSEKFRLPSPRTLTEECAAIWREHCERCPNECDCRTIDELNSDPMPARLASKLMAVGKLDRDKLYDMTKLNCPNLGEIAGELNVCTTKLMEEAIRENKTQIFAFDYEAMAQMFSDAVSASNVSFSVDRVLSDRLHRALLRAGMRVENLLVCGDRKKYVIATGAQVVSSDLSAEELRRVCEAVCGVPFCAPSFMLEHGRSAVTLAGESPFFVEYAGKQYNKRGERVCGDSVSVIKNEDSFFYCFICDGMGSGEEAALTARLSKVFLEKMLACGNRKSTTLEMLNNFLCAKSGESFATVDLLEIDLMLGTASFVKSGAVPSYVIRDRQLFQIASGTFPIGILTQVSAEVTEFELHDGDVIVLCSDGVASDIEAEENANPAWFPELLANEWTDDLGRMATRILDAAQTTSSRSDDMTVELVRIRRKESAEAEQLAS